MVPDKPARSELITRPLCELEFPVGSLIGVVIRGEEVTIAGGKTVLAPGDRVMVIAMTAAIAAVEALFQ
jgi:trk system potassium uptake protein TrkA